MSHGKVRHEKTCLNCGTPVPDRFCPHCGQENIEPKQSVWHLVNHFFSDVTHFDGKFFVTVKDLFKKPGFLSAEYVKGRRVSYLDPIRMYIFTSAFFFLIFFSLVNLHDLEKNRVLGNKEGLEKARLQSLRLATTHEDSVAFNATFDGLEAREDEKLDNTVVGRVGRKMREKTDSAIRAADSIAALKADTADASGHAKKENDRDDDEEEDKPKKHQSKDDDLNINLGSGDDDHEFKSIAAYDSAQAALPPAQRDNWLKRGIKRKNIEINEKWRGDREGMWREWAAGFLHSFPKILFVSLPLFALLLKMLYVRRKDFYYVDHGIFSVHLYIFSFLVLLVYFGLQKLHTLSGWKIFTWLEIAAFLYPFWYYYKAMRNFYHQSRAKTLLKYLLLLFLSLIFQLTLFVLFFVFSIVQS